MRDTHHYVATLLVVAAAMSLACGDSTAATEVMLPGNIRVSTTTSGTNPDADGYSLLVQNVGRFGLEINDSRTISNVAIGQWVLLLEGVASNCAVDGPTYQTVSVTSGATVEVAFAIRCVEGAGWDY